MEKKKVAILGFAPHWELAPFNDKSFEIWGLNDLYNSIPRWDRWFEIHDWEVYELDKIYARQDGSSHVEGLKKLNCPVYMVKHYEDIPNSIPYPIEKAIKFFNTRYFTNTISMMIALAIMEGFQEIHIYGVDMAVGSEYGEQRPSCEYFIGEAKGRGITVYIPPEADLLQTAFIYGFEDRQRTAYEAKLDNLIQGMEQRKAGADQVIANQQEVSHQYAGAIQAIRDIKRVRIL
jgi:hypothetical protein